jgi:hypothetical protein
MATRDARALAAALVLLGLAGAARAAERSGISQTANEA